MAKRQVSAKKLLQDIRAGITDAGFREKYSLTVRGLERLLGKLQEGGFITQEELAARITSDRKTTAVPGGQVIEEKPGASSPNEKAIRLIDYLIKLASLGTKILRDAKQYEFLLWLHEIPVEKGCFTKMWASAEGHDEDYWIEVQTYQEPETPQVPEECSGWVDKDALRASSKAPGLQKTIEKEVPNPEWKEGEDPPQSITRTMQLDDHPEVLEAWDRYIEEKWAPWKEQHESWEKVQKIYTRMFAIHQEQRRLGEDYELVLAMGLLTWQTATGQQVRRHLLVANAQLEFEAGLRKFTIRPNTDGANLRLELDMLDLTEQPADAEELVKESLKAAADDPWDRESVESVLKSLAHSIKPDGEYYEHVADKVSTISEQPIVQHAPALILRKRSVRGLTAVLDSIKGRIESQGNVPLLFKELAEMAQHEDEAPLGGNQRSRLAESEIWFPKPSNEEQRRIVQNMRRARGVLVQGPPGTGKSHTIANLICHLLATGQRILVTAKTPRALEVLERLVPEELRPLCINLLGSGPEEKRSLEASVTAILWKNEQWDKDRAQEEINEIERKLGDLREEKASIENRLRAIRESEAHTQVVVDGRYHGAAVQIAQAIAGDASKYNWFKDGVRFDQSYQLSDVDFERLISGLRRLATGKSQELRLSWPESVPDIDHIKELFEKELRAVELSKSTSLDLDENFLGQISSVHKDTIALIRDLSQGLLREIRFMKSQPYGWVSDAIRDVLSGDSATWKKIQGTSELSVGSIEGIAHKADTTHVVLPETRDQRAVLDDAVNLQQYLANGGGLGWGPFRNKFVKSVKYVLHECSVNGHLCKDQERIDELVGVLRVRVETDRAWSFWTGLSRRPGGPYALQLQALKSHSEALKRIIDLEMRVTQCREALATGGLVLEPLWHDESYLDAMVSACNHAMAVRAAGDSSSEIEQLEPPLASAAAKASAHPVVRDLLQAVRSRDLDGYARAYERRNKLDKQRKTVQWVEQVLDRLRSLAPQLAEDLKANSADTSWDERLRLLPEAWQWAQGQNWLDEFINRDDAPSLATRQRQLEQDIGKATAQIASLRAWSFCFDRMEDEHRQHMVAWQQAIAKVGKGTGKHAPKYLKEAQEHLNGCREAVPAWVMPLHRVWDTVAPAPEIFDVIVVDEASQCGFESLPLLYLARKILIVGDDKQISPDAVGIAKGPVFDLMQKYLHDFHFKSSFDVDSSLFDQGRLRYGTHKVSLTEHFRCMPEIIQFSDDLCYAGARLIPLRQYPPDRLPPLVHVRIENGYREGSDSLVFNRPEADAIVDKIVELCADTRYSGKTMGVVILQGERQGRLIEEELLPRLGAAEIESRRLICGNPYSFQGDERDIMFLSMVAAPNERIGPFTSSSDERRFNVAASRARDQMWLFHSVTREDLSASCLRMRLLKFFEETKQGSVKGVDKEELRLKAQRANRAIEGPPEPFDSWFEVDVALEIAGRNYLVVPQFQVAGKRIDLVVEGGHMRLAVECDGEKFHGAEQYEQDMQRQRMLERCGWVFYRVRGSAFYADKEAALAGLWETLDQRGIAPQIGESST